MRAALPALLLAAGCAAPGLPPAGGGGGAVGADGLPRACGVAGAALGAAIETQAGFTIHDTAPGSTAPRVHHVTGFADGCPRAVTAAALLFGDLAGYELTHYVAHVPDTEAADIAYEGLKGRVCGVAAGQPCGAGLDRLARDTVFLSAYPVLGGEAHADWLLHAGQVVGGG